MQWRERKETMATWLRQVEAEEVARRAMRRVQGVCNGVEGCQPESDMWAEYVEAAEYY